MSKRRLILKMTKPRSKLWQGSSKRSLEATIPQWGQRSTPWCFHEGTQLLRWSKTGLCWDHVFSKPLKRAFQLHSIWSKQGSHRTQVSHKSLRICQTPSSILLPTTTCLQQEKEKGCSKERMMMKISLNLLRRWVKRAPEAQLLRIPAVMKRNPRISLAKPRRLTRGRWPPVSMSLLTRVGPKRMRRQSATAT